MVRDTLPVIPIPLKLGDADASVPLQEVFDTVYQRVRHELSVKYNAPLEPPLTLDVLRWVQSPSNHAYGSSHDRCTETDALFCTWPPNINLQR